MESPSSTDINMYPSAIVCFRSVATPEGREPLDSLQTKKQGGVHTKIFEELVQLPRETADALSRFIFDAKYNFMFLDCSTGQIYNFFDLIKVNDNAA